jgi:hypothetical protein
MLLSQPKLCRVGTFTAGFDRTSSDAPMADTAYRLGGAEQAELSTCRSVLASYEGRRTSAQLCAMARRHLCGGDTTILPRTSGVAGASTAPNGAGAGAMKMCSPSPGPTGSSLRAKSLGIANNAASGSLR